MDTIGERERERKKETEREKESGKFNFLALQGHS